MSIEFIDDEAEDAQPKPPNGHDAKLPIWVDDEDWVEADIPRRPWVAKGYALRGAVTVVVGPPSTMKSSLMLTWAVSTVLGQRHGDFQPTAPSPATDQDNSETQGSWRPLGKSEVLQPGAHVRMNVHAGWSEVFEATRGNGSQTSPVAAQTQNVVVYNVEDNQAEQRRRLSAVLRQFNAQPKDIAGKLIRIGPVGVGTLFVRDKLTGQIVSTPAMDQLRNVLRERSPALLIADPLSELHNQEENDNNALRQIVAEFRAIAVEFNIAIILVHHTRKGPGTPGDPDSARGASSIIGAGRIVVTLVGMSEDDAKELGLPKDRKSRSGYVRLDGAKSNYSGIGEPEWYEKILYTLDNGETVPAAVPWRAPDIWRSIPPAVANRILDDIDAGADGGKQRYSGQPNAKKRGAYHVVQQHVSSLTDEQARKIIKTWLNNQVLFEVDCKDAAEGKGYKGLRTNDANRPGQRNA